MFAPIRVTSRPTSGWVFGPTGPADGGPRDAGVDGGIDGLGVGRHRDARAREPHLVLVEPDLREPLVVHGARDGPRLLLRQHPPAAVVVVADVVVVEPRLAPALVTAAEVLAVPLALHDLAVRIDR